MNSPKQAQSILAFILVFIALLGLSIGMLRIWTWFSANYAQREVIYQTSRLTAGKPNLYRDTSESSQYTYIDIGGADTTINPDQKFQPLNLTEDWVFRGQPSGMVGSFGGGELSRDELESQCRNNCLGQAGCGATVDDFYAECPCFVKCMCTALTQNQVTALGNQATSMRERARNLRINADSMRERAEDCDDPWEICWWGTWGKTADELNEAADHLDDTADTLDARAADIERTRDQIVNCCTFETYETQDACMDFAQDRSCEDTVGDLVDAIDGELEYLYPEKILLERTIQELDDSVTTCNGKASTICGCQDGWDRWCWDWGWDDLGYMNYDSCYEGRRNACCQTFCCNEDATRCCLDDEFCWGCSSWDRSCDEPSTNCDVTCTDIRDCNECGLKPLSDSLQNKLDTEVSPLIDKFEGERADISPCCNSGTGAEQWDCILDAMKE